LRGRARAFEGVTHRANQPARVALAFHQIILGSFVHGLKGQRLVTGTAQHDDRHLRGRRMERLKRLDAVAVRQRQVKQHQVNAAFGQPRDGPRKAPRGFHLEAFGVPFADEFKDEARVARVVLDEQDPGAGRRDGGRSSRPRRRIGFRVQLHASSRRNGVGGV